MGCCASPGHRRKCDHPAQNCPPPLPLSAERFGSSHRRGERAAPRGRRLGRDEHRCGRIPRGPTALPGHAARAGAAARRRRCRPCRSLRSRIARRPRPCRCTPPRPRPRRTPTHRPHRRRRPPLSTHRAVHPGGHHPRRLPRLPLRGPNPRPPRRRSDLQRRTHHIPRTRSHPRRRNPQRHGHAAGAGRGGVGVDEGRASLSWSWSWGLQFELGVRGAPNVSAG